ncbi:MAG TPA: hypothetical protein VN278_01545, partial [Methanosarcina sp.]|nr:hypothetical protein [Methanosarcina sp.]
MLENITVGTCMHLLSQIENEALDYFWWEISNGRYPIIDLESKMSYSIMNQEGLLFIRNDFTASTYTQYELVFGGFFLPDTVEELLSQDEILLLIVYNHGTQELLLSMLDIDGKFMLDLPYGTYSFFAFIVDAKAENLLDSSIQAMGLPCRENCNNPELEGHYHEYPVNILEFIEFAPINIKRGGPFYVNLIMIDIGQIPDCYALFSEILQ